MGVCGTYFLNVSILCSRKVGKQGHRLRTKIEEKVFVELYLRSYRFVK